MLVLTAASRTVHAHSSEPAGCSLLSSLLPYSPLPVLLYYYYTLTINGDSSVEQCRKRLILEVRIAFCSWFCVMRSLKGPGINLPVNWHSSKTHLKSLTVNLEMAYGCTLGTELKCKEMDTSSEEFGLGLSERKMNNEKKEI